MLTPPSFPPTMDSAPELCPCGRKTVESHDYWFCSIECARQDSLRSLRGRHCHYRDVVRNAYDKAGVQRPRRMASAVDVRRGAPDHQRFANLPLPPLPQPNHADLARIAPWLKLEHAPGSPPFPPKDVTRTAAPGERVTHAASRARPGQGPTGGDHDFIPISLDAIPFPQHVPLRPLRKAPSSIDGFDSRTKKSRVAALLNFGWSRRDRKVANPDKVFGHYVNTCM